MVPKAPALGSVRLANLNDVPRLAVVATSGFYYSPVFAWERSHHHNYPRDTYKSYQRVFADIIRDPEYVALVAEDSFVENESEKTGATINPGEDYTVPAAGSRAVGGVATWKLQPDSAPKGQFVDEADLNSTCKPKFDGGEETKKNNGHAQLLNDECEAREKKYLKAHQLVDMLLLHPAYWRWGHGTQLVEWGLKLAKLNLIKQGVIAAEMGEKLYLSMSFRKLDNVNASDPDDPEQKKSVSILEYISPCLKAEL